jgi:hypothetical protein
MPDKNRKPDQPTPHGAGIEVGGAQIPERVHHRPSKGEPVIRAGDAGGPNEGRNLTTADIDHDAGKSEPNVLERNAYSADKPRKKDERS